MQTNDKNVSVEIIPTIFPNFNAKNNFAKDHTTSSLTIARLKHGHLRAMQKMKETDHIHYLMAQLTGLSQDDLDELDAEDSAKLSEVIFSFMKGYAKIAKDMAE